MTQQKTLKSIFLSRTYKDENGCLIWKGAKNLDTGYGIMTISKEYMLAHRVSFELFNGEIKSGNVVCHKCDNPSCVNPDHLFQGSHKDNCVDMVKKSRAKRRRVRGEVVAFSADQIRAIRAYKGKQADLARKYGVTDACISLIKNYKTHKHIKD